MLIMLLPIFTIRASYPICYDFSISHNFTICHDTCIVFECTICYTLFMPSEFLGKVSMNVKIWKQNKEGDHVTNQRILHPQRIVTLDMKRDNTVTEKNAKLDLKQKRKKGKEIKENKHYLFLVALSSHALCTTTVLWHQQLKCCQIFLIGK